MSTRTIAIFGMISACVFAVSALGACGSSSENGGPGGGANADGGTSSDGGGSTSDGGIVVPPGQCLTTLRYTPPAGTLAHTASLVGEWNNFVAPGTQMTGPDTNGAFVAQVALAPGLTAYKVLLNGTDYELDPGSKWRKYVGGVENSGVRVADCHVPTLTVNDNVVSRPAAGQGTYTAHVAFHPGTGMPAIDPTSVSATLRTDTASTPTGATYDPAQGIISVNATSLIDGKYTVFVNAKDTSGAAATPLRLVFWVESEAFDWHDSLIYMVMTDRFVDGDPSNDAAPTAGVDPRADYQGGDLEGVRQKIADGTFDNLGVRVLWLSPFNQNPAGPYPASDGVHTVMGYHGYWPTKARQVDTRMGDETKLKALVAEAHAHGIRVLQDYVINQVHEEHEYFAAHPEWFRTGCICGTDNCDWTVHRLDCLFASYMPDVNWTLPEVNEQWSDDAVWWIDTFDLDGMRMDAVKQVEDAAIVNLSSRIRGEFESSGTKVFLTGETAMGWSDCDLSCNQSQYDLISHFVTLGLDGQFDFVLYYAVPLNVFSADNKGMIHADYWTQASGWEYPQGAIMSPYIGSQDTARLVTISDDRGQDAAHDASLPYNQWTNSATVPTDSDPYSRQRLAMSWLLTNPGAPMIYYGDEYGQWGGVDPNNRAMWRGEGTLSADEQATLAYTRQLGQARKELVALRRGAYWPVASTDDWLVFGRVSGSNAALVAITRSTSGATFTATLPVTMPLANGTVLHDRLGGPDITVQNGSISMALGARAAAILAP